MTPSELIVRLAAVAQETNDWETAPGEWSRDDTDEALEAWDRLDRLIENLMALRHDYAVTLARRLPDEYTAEVGNDYVTVHREVPAKHAWDGHGVLDALSQPMVDTATGEVTSAIPTDIARDVIPACGQGHTSSKWKITGLRKHVRNADRFHEVEYGTPVIGRGPLVQGRNRKPTTPSPASTPDDPPDVHTDVPNSVV